MKVLVTGNLGYIGSVMTDELVDAGFDVLGYDAGYLMPHRFMQRKHEVAQIKKDIRDVDASDLAGVDAIFHLAALSNDPLGNLNPTLTEEINHAGSVKLAEAAKKAGVERYVFSSSCSLYGASGQDAVTEESAFNPLTPYAKSKVDTERDVSKLADDSFSPVFMRNGTVFGVSPRLRFDLVVNNMTGWAVTTNEIKMYSDGTPWRPNVHIKDVANAFMAALTAPKDAIHNQAFNVGMDSENYQIREIADHIAKIVPDTEVNCLNQNPSDARSYRVSFAKIREMLPDFKPKHTLDDGIKEVYEACAERDLTLTEFEKDIYLTVKHMKKLIKENKVDANLRWVK